MEAEIEDYIKVPKKTIKYLPLWEKEKEKEKRKTARRFGSKTIQKVRYISIV